MSDCNCNCNDSSHVRHAPRTWLFQLQTDGAGTSALTRLPPGGRLWAVLGNENGGNPYQVWIRYGGKSVQVDNSVNGLHMTTMLPCFPDGFVYLQGGAANTLYLLSVTE